MVFWVVRHSLGSTVQVEIAKYLDDRCEEQLFRHHQTQDFDNKVDREQDVVELVCHCSVSVYLLVFNPFSIYF